MAGAGRRSPAGQQARRRPSCRADPAPPGPLPLPAQGERAEQCPTHLWQMHVCLPAKKGHTRLLYRMATDFMDWTNYVPGIQHFWRWIAGRVRPTARAACCVLLCCAACAAPRRACRARLPTRPAGHGASARRWQEGRLAVPCHAVLSVLGGRGRSLKPTVQPSSLPLCYPRCWARTWCWWRGSRTGCCAGGTPGTRPSPTTRCGGALNGAC